MYVINACHRNEHVPDPVQGHWDRECQDQQSVVVCDRWQHMPVLAEGLQTEGQYFNFEKRCPTLNAYDSWDEKSIVKVSHGVACPDQLSIAVLHKCSWLTTFPERYIYVNESHKRTYLKWCEINWRNDYLCHNVQQRCVSREEVEHCPKFPRIFPYVWHFFRQR